MTAGDDEEVRGLLFEKPAPAVRGVLLPGAFGREEADPV
jgi:hypothetical protein